MDQIFDRLGNLLKSFVQDDDDNIFVDGKKTAFTDPDLQDAWDELDEFMRTGESTAKASQNKGPTPATPDIPAELKKDYQILQVPFGTPLEEVAKSYKTLLRKHHPDKHATDPAAFAKATETTKKLTSSFRRIRQYVEKGIL